METTLWNTASELSLKDTIDKIIKNYNIITVVTLAYHYNTFYGTNNISEAVIIYDKKPYKPGTGCGPG